MTDIPTRVLSDAIVHSKYARWWGELGRRETYEEVVARNRQMVLDHLSDKAPLLCRDEDLLRTYVDQAYKLVLQKKVLPAMRSMQFAGAPILRDHNRIYNCGFMHANRIGFFRELLFLLLGGSGIGYSVQSHHVAMLPPVRDPRNWQRFIIDDTIKGWADAVDALMRAYLEGGVYPEFDYREIRPEGSVLKTSGGKAPGPRPLAKMLRKIEGVLIRRRMVHDQLRPIDVHDIACHIADAVLAGGIRRSAMIALFDPSDEDMLYAKSGKWWEDHPQRALANNSAVLERGVDEDLFDGVFDVLQQSGSGEPGIFWTNDLDLGTNPCAEISLHDRQFCNLTTMNVGDVKDQADLNERARAAAILGTLQAAFTDFHYLDVGWREQTRKEYLIGVSMTGIAAGNVQSLDLAQAAAVAKAANREVADLLGIGPAARVTTVKPEGTASLVLSTSSGIHAWHDDFYIRRVRFNKTEAIAQYLMAKLPYRPEHVPGSAYPVEDLVGKEETEIVLGVPQRAPEGAATRDEGALALLERVADVTRRWIIPGHRSGANSNNVSTTVNVKEGEWDAVRAWMFENRDLYSGIAILPYDGGTYVQAPFETITEELYHEAAAMFETIDVTEIDEAADYTTLAGEAACAGGACEVTFA